MTDYDDEVHGCSDGYCIWKKPKGMHTNGGCKCLHSLERSTRYWEAMNPAERGDLHRQWLTTKHHILIMRDEIARLREETQ